MRGQAGFWDIDQRYVRLSEAGDAGEAQRAGATGGLPQTVGESAEALRWRQGWQAAPRPR